MLNLRVMILDDEERILFGLKQFNWKEHHCTVTVAAKNGAEGLKLLKEAMPDIIISDIQMPVMNGLDFAKEAKIHFPQVEIILLSGYDEFEYAKTAIKVGVREYLLKPLNFVELERLLDRIYTEREENILEEQQMSEFMERYRRSMPAICQQYVSDLIKGNIRDKKEIEKRMESIDVHIDKYVCVKARVYQNRKMENWLREFAVMNMADSLAADYCKRLLSCMDGAEYCFVAVFDSFVELKDCLEACFGMCGRLQKTVRDLLKEDICFGISELDADPYNIPEFMEAATIACDHSSLLGNDSIIQYSDIPSQRIHWKISDGQKRRLTSLVSTGDLEGIEEYVNLIFSLDGKYVESARVSAVEMIYSILAYSDSFKEQNSIKLMQASIEKMESVRTMEEIRRYVIKMLVRLAKNKAGQANDKNQSFVNGMLGYLELSYKNDVSLDEVSEEFHVSRNYITRLLKKYTGKNFSDNLLDIRMHKAVELMTTMDYSVSAIAELVGYHDASYFIQVFKKNFGMTPNDYKKLF